MGQETVQRHCSLDVSIDLAPCCCARYESMLDMQWSQCFSLSRSRMSCVGTVRIGICIIAGLRQKMAGRLVNLVKCLCTITSDGSMCRQVYYASFLGITLSLYCFGTMYLLGMLPGSQEFFCCSWLQSKCTPHSTRITR